MTRIPFEGVRAFSLLDHGCERERGRRQIVPQFELPDYGIVRDRPVQEPMPGRNIMSRIFLIPFLTVAFLMAPSVLPIRLGLIG